ncbi:sigma-54-dependent transcriptional regulator [Humisphaera borealis]|uniref:Sigma-54-dependent Fis family transcriptional regulator n=1 Tax=Humisphaera borealis TaxID=2807512 RepID=A0A7M2WVP7_9BACT|nr:sigma-54 dependent transcriptional regulator [Humisphaera borealis]QOV89536.1 sigma-54-dependent Fis family transcriptional regulator [Humisphaera borealis]
MTAADPAPADTTTSTASSRLTVLVVDDTPANLDTLVGLLERQDYDVLAVSSGEAAVRVAASAMPHIILLDVVMSGIDGYETCRRLKALPETREIPVLFVSARDGAESLLSGFAVGGVDYISKPFEAAEVLARVGAHLRIAQLTRELSARNADLLRQDAELRSTLDALQQENARRERAEDALRTVDGRLAAMANQEAERWDVGGFIGRSATLRRILADIARVRNFGSINVLVTGESGTGKELVARAIHGGSPRAGGPFIAINCVAIPADLAESTLFGHTRGAFTGATADRKGYFELADGGTLFLDEIGDMPVALQAKLLRVLEDGKITPIGSSREKRVNVRIVAATNANLDRQIANGVFRQDLYFRLSQYCVRLPPLRERTEDIPLLAEHFVRLFAREMGLVPPAISPAVFRSLAMHAFPGNVRELKNVIERCLIESGGEAIELEHLATALPTPLQTLPVPTPAAPLPVATPTIASSAATPPASDALSPVADLPLNLEEAETLLMKRALAETGGNVAEAARRLGVNRTRIYRKLGNS